MSLERRIVIADGQTLVRAGVRCLLEQLESVLVIAELGDGLKVPECVARRLPDVLIIDPALPGLNGREVARRVARNVPHVRILFLANVSTPELVLRGFEAGAHGYLLKCDPPVELVKALMMVIRGSRYVSPGVDLEVLGELRRSGNSSASRLCLLTARQRQILQLIAEGNSTRAIAASLCLSPKTVESHRAELMKRLGIAHVAGLTRFAVSEGLVPMIPVATQSESQALAQAQGRAQSQSQSRSESRPRAA